MNKAVFLDRDGVINEEVDHLNNVADLRILPGAASAIKKMNEAGYHVIVVSNQAAIAKGIKEVVFDRGGMRYHWSKGKGKDGKPVTVLGKLASLAEAARAAGLKF